MSLDSLESSALNQPESKVPILPRDKFFILCQYRTGSSLLASLLNSHPDLYCDGELFNAKKRKNDLVIFPRFYVHRQVKKAVKAEQPQYYGFDLKIQQIIELYKRHHLIRKDRNSIKIVKKLHQNGWKIIHLRRENIVKQAISNLVAQKRQRWVYRNDQDKQLNSGAVVLDPDCLWQTLRWIQWSTRVENRALADLSYQEVIYEQGLLDASMHQKTADQVFAYLGLPSAMVETSLVRASSDQLSDSVKNFDEIQAVLQGTEYEKYLT